MDKKGQITESLIIVQRQAYTETIKTLDPKSVFYDIIGKNKGDILSIMIDNEIIYIKGQ